MTKTKYILILIAGALLCTGCNRDEKDLFDTPAALRLNQAMSQAENILVGAENGWEMLYFPNPASAGYSVLLKFSSNGQVTIASRNPQTTSNTYKIDDNSTWAIKADYGPILSFDTYNRILHAWADPQTDGDGYLGDYEFLILSSNTDCIRMKGKKHESYIYMYPLDKDLSWTAYFDQVYQQREYLVSGNNGTSLMYVEDNTSLELTVQTSILVNATVADEVYPFVVRPNCITFHGDGLGNKAINFIINEDRTAYLCTDGVNGKIVPAHSLSYIFNQKLKDGKQWDLSKSDMGSESLAAYNVLKDALKASQGTLRSILLQRIKKEDDQYTDQLQIEYNGSQGISQAFFEMNYALTDDNYTISYSKAILDDKNLTTEFLLRAGEGDENTGVERVKNLVCGTYAVSSASGCVLNASQLYFTDSTNPNKRLRFSVK